MIDQNEKNVRSGQQGTNEPWKKPGQSSQDPALEKSRPTEDDLAREHLGGTRGHPSLGEAPMTGQRRKKTFPKDENDGHVA